jgi:iron uptake system component EfeO
VKSLLVLLGFVVAAFGLSGCSSCSKESPATNDTQAHAALKTNVEYNAEAARGIHDSMEGDLAELLQSAKDLQAAAPVPAGRGWDAAVDADAIASMKRAWLRARVAYEHVEGVIGAMFPDID